jgi:hypothetical protein
VRPHVVRSLHQIGIERAVTQAPTRMTGDWRLM